MESVVIEHVFYNFIIREIFKKSFEFLSQKFRFAFFEYRNREMKFCLFLFATSQGTIFEISSKLKFEKKYINETKFWKFWTGRGLTFDNSDYDDYNVTADGGYYDYHDYDASEFERGTAGSRKDSEMPCKAIIYILLY